MVVNVGDIIKFPMVKPEKVQVTWQQNWANRTKYFYFVLFEVQGRQDAGYVAVEDVYWEKFTNMATKVEKDSSDWQDEEPMAQLKVTQEFRYGQNQERTFRFLVLGDKSDKMFQHRFASAFQDYRSATSFQNFGEKVNGAINAYFESSEATDMVKSIVGDPLREF